MFYICILLLFFTNRICLCTGCVEGTKASHLDGCDCQCHLWNLLGHRRNTACLRRLWLLQYQSCCNSHCTHNAHVQLRCQSVCIRIDKPTIQGKDQGDDVLQITCHCTDGSSCESITGHRVGQQRDNPADRHERAKFHRVMRCRRIPTRTSLNSRPMI